MKELIRKLFKSVYKEDLVQVIKESCPVPAKTNREKLHEFFITFANIDPTPEDKVPDEISCVYSLTTIISKFIPFPILEYTPNLLSYLKSDKRFKETSEFKEGNIILSVTKTGNNSIMGHVGCISKGGKILSNSSATGLFTDKYDLVSWVERYSRQGQLAVHIFELL